MILLNLVIMVLKIEREEIECAQQIASLPIILMFVIFYFIIIRPHKKGIKIREMRAILNR